MRSGFPLLWKAKSFSDRRRAVGPLRGIVPAVTYKKKKSKYQVWERWPPLLHKKEETGTNQEEKFREVHVNGIPWGRPGRSEMPWVFIFLRVVSIFTRISVFVSLIAFVFLLQVCFVGRVLFTVILQSVISVIYCPMVFILPSQFYLSFSYGLTF